jgi:hypothetical protein
MKVVLTAPIPGVSTPSFPFGGATLTGLRIRFPPVQFVIDDSDESKSHDKIAPPAATFTPSVLCAPGASRKPRFVSCAADELFRRVPRA